MKVLVIGAAGQLGSNLVRALLKKGDQVRVFTRPTSKTSTLQSLDVERVTGDLNEFEKVKQACRGVQVVYQTAGYYPTEAIPAPQAQRQALQETRNLLHAVSSMSVDRLVFTSTLTTVGPPAASAQLATENCDFSTKSKGNPYLLAKAAMEKEVLAAAKNGLPAVVVIPTVFFGPFDQRPTSGTQILMIAKRLMPGYIQGLVNVIDVRDVAVAMIRAAEVGAIGERYIIGNWNTTQKELNQLIARVVGVTPPLIPLPFVMARVGSQAGEWVWPKLFNSRPPFPSFFLEVIRHMQHYDCSKAIKTLQYPTHPVENAIRDAVRWFRENDYL